MPPLSTNSLNSRRRLRAIADNDIDNVYTSIFDVHMDEDITMPSCPPSLALIRSLRLSPLPPMLPVVQVGGGTFSIEGMRMGSFELS
jgi:hypothetical protein